MRNGKLTDKEKMQAIMDDWRQECEQAQSPEQVLSAYRWADEREQKLARMIERRDNRGKPRPKKPNLRRVRAIKKRIETLIPAEQAKLLELLGITKAFEQERASSWAHLQRRNSDFFGHYGTMKHALTKRLFDRNAKPRFAERNAEIVRLRDEKQPDGKKLKFVTIRRRIRDRWPLNERGKPISEQDVRAAYGDTKKRIRRLNSHV